MSNNVVRIPGGVSSRNAAARKMQVPAGWYAGVQGDDLIVMDGAGRRMLLPERLWKNRTAQPGELIAIPLDELVPLNGNGRGNGTNGTGEGPIAATEPASGLPGHSEGDTLIAAAVELGRLGYRVFPVRPDAKRPFESGWQETASTNAERIRGMWTARPRARIGIAPEGFTVIDVDPRNGGMEPEGLPADAPRVSTASGGLHVYVHGDVRGRFGDGVDLKRAGGFVLAPPSKGYTWLSGPVAVSELPEAAGLVEVEPAAEVDQAGLQAPSLAALRAVVEQIPNDIPDRDGYVKMGHAIRAAGGPESFEVFEEWCSRWDAGENDPAVVRRDWESFRGPFRVGFEWLRGLVRVEAREVFEPVPEAADPADPFKVEAPRGELANLDPAWWDARPELARIRDHALSQGRGPDAVFGARAVIENALAGPRCVIEDTGTGENLSGNLSVIVPGHRATNKSSANRAARRSLRLAEPDREDTDLRPGTWQGAIDHYIEYPPQEKPGQKRPPPRQVKDHGVFFVSEVTTLEKLFEASGCLLSEGMREAFYAEGLGQLNSKQGGRTRRLEAGSYTMGWIIAGQQGNCGPILGAAAVASGLASRFLVLSPHKHRGHAHSYPDRPEPDSIALPWQDSNELGRERMTLDADIIRENRRIQRELEERLRRVDIPFPADAKTGHDLALHAKVAMYLTRLAGRMHISRDDWSTAAHVIDVSNYNKGVIARVLASEAYSKAASAGRLQAVQDASRDSWREERRGQLRRGAVRYLRKHGAGTERQIRKGFIKTKHAGVDGPILTEALDSLVEDGTLLRIEDDRRPHYGAKYELAKTKAAPNGAAG